MPFDLFIGRAGSYDMIRRPRKSWFRKFAPILPEEFEAAIEGAPAHRRPDGDYWVRHGEDDSPWFAARLNPAGVIVFSTSYTNHRFPRNFADMFDLALHFAEGFGASLFEEVGGRRVTPKNVDGLLDMEGDYVGLQLGTFKGIRDRMFQEGTLGLEYPLGPIDSVSSYFTFELDLPDGAPASPAELLEATGLTERANDVGQRGVAFGTKGEPPRSVFHVFERRVRFAPVGMVAPFAECAGATLEVFDVFARRFPGNARFRELPLDEKLMAEIRRRSTGLGVDFFEWIYERTTGEPFMSGRS